MPTPSPDPTISLFYGVDATASNDVWAVGEGFGTLATRWNGSDWSLVASHNVGLDDNILNDIDGIYADDMWAVGYALAGAYQETSLTLHWDGGSWTLVPSPNAELGTTLEGAAAIAADDVWAVGYSDSASGGSSTAALHWNGTDWSFVPTPNPAGASVDRLYAVDALASDDVWAVGEFWPNQVAAPLILHWDGSAWSQIPHNCGASHRLDALTGISALAPDDIWAVGNALTCHYDGTGWVEIPSPQPSGNILHFPLEDVSGSSPDDVWAVGRYIVEIDEALFHYAFAEHWDGRTWTPVLWLPGVRLYDVEALASDDVWVVGTHSIGTLILHWDGQSWHTVPSPDPEVSGDLRGLEIFPVVKAWVVGSFFTEDNTFRTLTLNVPSETQGSVRGQTNVSGATVSWFGPATGSTSANAFGAYAAAGLLAGTYFVTATDSGGCDPDGATVEIIAGQTVFQDFTLDCN